MPTVVNTEKKVINIEARATTPKSEGDITLANMEETITLTKIPKYLAMPVYTIPNANSFLRFPM